MEDFIYSNPIKREHLLYLAVNGIAHSFESYFKVSVQAEFIDRQIEAIISTIISTTEILIDNQEDSNIRAHFSWAVINAKSGLIFVENSNHTLPNFMIEESLSSLFNLTYSRGLSIAVLAWMKWHYKNNIPQFEQFSNRIFGLYSSQEGIKALENWFNKIGMPTKLSHISIKKEDINFIVENTCKNAQSFSLSELYTKEVLKEILNNAL